MDRVVRNPKACYGCRACELICAYRRLKAFSPGGGAIRVEKNNRTGKVSWVLSGECDLCEGERELLCVRHCPYGALSHSKKTGRRDEKR